MKRSLIFEEPRTLTVADLCEALMDGTLQAQVQNGNYTLRRGDLMKFAKSPSQRRNMMAFERITESAVASN